MQMDLEEIVLSEVSQTEKGKYHRLSLICRIYKKTIHMNLLSKQKQTHRQRKQTCGYQRGKWGKDKSGVED